LMLFPLITHVRLSIYSEKLAIYKHMKRYSREPELDVL
jgi:hypothetical protein